MEEEKKKMKKEKRDVVKRQKGEWNELLTGVKDTKASARASSCAKKTL